MSLLRCVEVLTQVQQAALVPYQLQYLSLPIHHVLILEYLLYRHDLSCLLQLSLHKQIKHTGEDLVRLTDFIQLRQGTTYLINFSECTASKHLHEVIFVEFACYMTTLTTIKCYRWLLHHCNSLRCHSLLMVQSDILLSGLLAQGWLHANTIPWYTWI